MNAPGILNMGTAASSVITYHIYYGVNNRIYRYEPSSNSSLEQYDFPAGEKVVLLRCPPPFFDNPQVAAVTWDGTQSRLYLFYISFTATPGTISAYSVAYGGFGKVVDAQYKFR